jgi:osmotically-inducible protein OsmY
MKVSVTAILGLVLTNTLTSCTSSDREQAKQQGREDISKARNEIRKDAKELDQKVNAAVQPDQESASDKLSHAKEEIKSDASRAGIKIDQATLLAKVKASLLSNAGLSTLTSVNVQLDGTVVTLSGTVANDNQKRSAGDAASQVSGITRVQNHLTVQQP